MAARTCVLHIGTHKTGTTLLQNFLQWNSAALGRAGVHFPATGWYGAVPGQHAVAWELLDGPASGQLEALAGELSGSTVPHAILSSEEFSLLHDRPNGLRALLECIQSAGYSIKILAYVRSQATFAESMFAERIKHQDVRTFSDFLAGVLDSGSFAAHGRCVTLELSRLLAPFAELVGKENIHLHPYPVGNDPLAIFHDFLEALQQLVPGFNPATLKFDLHRTRMNESLSFGHLLGTAFVSLFPDVGLPNDPDEFIEAHAPSLPRQFFDTRFSLLEHHDYERFLERFAADNRRVLDEYGVTAPLLSERDIPDATNPCFAVAAFERPLLDSCIRRWLAGAASTVGNNA